MIDRLLLEGQHLTADIREAIVAGTPRRRQDVGGAWTVTFDLLDRDDVLVGSDLFGQSSQLQLDDVTYRLVRVNADDTDPILTVEFEDAVAAALRDKTGTVTVEADTTTRGGFAERLADEAGVSSTVDDSDPVRNPFGRGVLDPEENSWDALGRLASDVNVRRLTDGYQLLFGSDEWLRSLHPPRTVRQGQGGVGRIGFTVDVGLPVATCRFTARAWQWPSGRPVDVTGRGPADGQWLVATVDTDGTTDVSAVTLTRPSERLPEPEHEAVTPNGADGTVYETGGTSSITPDFVAVALRQAGKPYVFGAEASPSDPDPRAFDCSELVEWALARVGVRFVDGSYNQKQACRTISIDQAVRTYGALLFRTPGEPGHVAISTGDGRTIEARGRDYGVGRFSATTGRAWTHGGLIPGITYR